MEWNNNNVGDELFDFKLKTKRDIFDINAKIITMAIIVSVCFLCFMIISVIQESEIEKLKKKLKKETKTEETVAERLETDKLLMSQHEVNIYISNPETEVDINEDTRVWESIGEFELTGYCSCPLCCGGGADAKTASGSTVVPRQTVAADPRVIPIGTTIKINGEDYVVQDTGSAVKGRIIDIYFDEHEDAKKFGRQKAEVYILKEG